MLTQKIKHRCSFKHRKTKHMHTHTHTITNFVLCFVIAYSKILEFKLPGNSHAIKTEIWMQQCDCEKQGRGGAQHSSLQLVLLPTTKGIVIISIVLQLKSSGN